MMVSNLADPDFTPGERVRHPHRPRRVDAGARPPCRSHRPRPLDAIPGGQSKTATWVLRGDTEGFYDLTASYAGTLEPFGDTVTVQAATEKQLHVWGGSALQLTVDADDTANERLPLPRHRRPQERRRRARLQPDHRAAQGGQEELHLPAPRAARRRRPPSWPRATPCPATTSSCPPSAAPWTWAGRSSARRPATSSCPPRSPATRPSTRPTRPRKVQVYGHEGQGRAWPGSRSTAPPATRSTAPPTRRPTSRRSRRPDVEPAPPTTATAAGGRSRDVPDGHHGLVRNQPPGATASPLMRHPLVTATSTSEAPSPTGRAPPTAGPATASTPVVPSPTARSPSPSRAVLRR